MKYLSKNKGITLIALIVTIIIIILSSITIHMLIGKNSIIEKASSTVKLYSKAEVEEQVRQALSLYNAEKALGEKVEIVSYLKESLSVVAVKNEENESESNEKEEKYSFILNKYKVSITEKAIIKIEEISLETAKVYDSVKDMKKDKKLQKGELVKTEGYYEKKYGGSAYYKVLDDTTSNVDDGKCIKLENGLFAELYVIGDTVTVNQFGAYGDGIHKDSEAIEKAFNSGYSNVTFESREYLADKEIKISTSNLNILGNKAKIVMENNFQYAVNYFLYIIGDEEKILNNIELHNLNIETNSVTYKGNDAVQLMIRYVDGLVISNCTFNVPELNKDKTRHTTNIWLTGSVSNAKIRDNELKNFSNSAVGGNIWISNSTSNISHNIEIVNNSIEKSSHDESISVWIGEIDNVDIKENRFYTKESKVDNPSDKVFRFGRDYSNEMQASKITNIRFTNNELYTEAKGALFTIETEDTTIIENNKIYFKFIGNYYSRKIFDNFNTNLLVRNNDFNINSDNDNIVFSFSKLGCNITNNKITMNCLIDQFQKNVSEYIFEKNTLNINRDAEDIFLNVTGEIKNNELNINDIEYKTILKYINYNFKENLKVESNVINFFNSDRWEENSYVFIEFNESNINKYDVNINKNVLKTNENTKLQYFIKMQQMKDGSIQKVNYNDNEYSNFKNILL